MNVIDTLLQRNTIFAKTRFSAALKIIPSKKTMIIGCVDPRVDPFDIFASNPARPPSFATSAAESLQGPFR